MNIINKIKLMSLAIPSKRSFLLWLVLAFLGVFIWVASMWQLEIITIWVSNDITHFEFPFFLEKLLGYNNGISVWMGRDIMYGFNALGYLFIFPISFYKIMSIADKTLKNYRVMKFKIENTSA